jgi:maltose/moltooligosaccharide transporter
VVHQQGRHGGLPLRRIGDMEGDKVDTPIDTTVEESTQVGPAAGVVETERPGADKFDTGKAVNYSVGNLGASAVYVLFNTGIPLYLRDYGVPNTLIGLLANERSIVGALVQPVVGRISDRTRSPLGRRRPFFLIGVPLMAISLMLLAIHPPFWVMMSIITVAAFFLAVAMDPYMSLLADLFPPSQRGRVGGILGFANALGGIIFLILAKIYWDQYEPVIFALTIVILVVAFGITFFTVKEPPVPARIGPSQEGQNTKLNPRQYVKNLMRYPEAAKYVLALTLFWLGNGGAVPYVTLFGEETLHLTGGDTFLPPIAYLVATVLAVIGAGYLADRISKKVILTTGLLLYGVGAIVGSQSQDMTQAMLALAVIGLGNAGPAATLNPLLTDLIPRKRTAEFIGLGSAVWSLVQPIGAVVAGLIVDFVTHLVGPQEAYRWTFIFAGVMVVMAAIVLQTVRPGRPVPED